MKKILLFILLVTFVSKSSAQGFLNLDFESAEIVTTGDPSFRAVFADSALYGWKAYVGGQPRSTIFFNNASLSSAWVTLQGMTNYPYPGAYPAIQGVFFAMLFGEFNPSQGDFHTNTAAIGQHGEIPSSARQLIYWGSLGSLIVTFNNQPLNFIQTGSTTNYNIYAANVTPYAGQSGELLFVNYPYGGGIGGPSMIDNLQFSSAPIPEPSTVALLGLGGLPLGWRRLKKSSA